MDRKQQELELEYQQKLEIEEKKIYDDARRKASEEQRLLMREKDEQLKAMKIRIEELKAAPAPPEPKGEALEKELQENLERTFSYDKFEEVKKGVRGADLVQTVRNTSGNDCGKILWEAKNTKDFQKTWIDKLKRDQRRAGAYIAVIVSTALPDGMDRFGRYEDVWITDYKSSAGLTTALRQILIEATRQKTITVGKESIKDVVYNYITSKEFALHVGAVVNSYQQMQEDLESEKRSITRIWSKREKQISTILDNVAGMYGSIQGLCQRALPEIESLSLDTIVHSDVVSKNWTQIGAVAYLCLPFPAGANESFGSSQINLRFSIRSTVLRACPERS